MSGQSSIRKRGLPHMRLLLLHPEDRFFTPECIDEIISAELPTDDPTGELSASVASGKSLVSSLWSLPTAMVD